MKLEKSKPEVKYNPNRIFLTKAIPKNPARQMTDRVRRLF